MGIRRVLGKVVDMSESKTRLIPADKTRVNVYERHELNYWTQKWRCTEAELRAAVEATNSIMADKIETHLMQSDRRVRAQSAAGPNLL